MDNQSSNSNLSYYVNLLTPYIWLLLFFAIPFLLIFKISFSTPVLSVPPVKEIFQMTSDYTLEIALHFKNYIKIFSDPYYIHALVDSLKIAAYSTFFCLLIGYGIAYGIFMMPEKNQTLLLLLIMLPFWISFLIRVYAIMNVLSANGVINDILLFFGIISKPLQLLNTSFAVSVGIVYCYLPFMVMPIFSALNKIDKSSVEAAYDLGAGPLDTFFRVILPLSKAGVFAGCILVFIPAAGEFVIPQLLGGGGTITIGQALWEEFFNNRDWSLASALAVLMVVSFVLPLIYFRRQEIVPD